MRAHAQEKDVRYPLETIQPSRRIGCIFGNTVALILLLALASSVQAGTVDDFDADLVPYVFDNCSALANGPQNATNQSDCDADGYGNACDADYDQDGLVTAADFGIFLAAFGAIFPAPVLDCRDHDGDNAITTADFGLFFGQFGGAPGPSGLACADPTLIVPPDQACDAQSP